MKNTGTLKVTTPTEREVVMTRVFDAPRRLVFDALTNLMKIPQRRQARAHDVNCFDFSTA